jgi:hypothetical protein
VDKRTCAVESCGRPVESRGWCSTHYGRWKRTGDPGADVLVVPRHPVHAPGATCAVDGCDRSPKDGSRGWCQAHYLRWKSAGDVRADIPIEARTSHASGAICAVNGCDARASVREWCNAHYQRWRAAGDPQAELPSRSRVESSCLIEGCLGPVEARGWCGKHYARWRKHGDPQYERERHATCLVADCDKVPRRPVGGYCEMHYTRWLRHGDFETHHPVVKPNDEVSYFLLHERLRKARGKATEYRCVQCGTQAKQWAQLHGADPCNFDNYVPMCLSCHRKYDTYPETREKNRRNGGPDAWTPKRRAEHSRLMTEWWAARRQGGSREDLQGLPAAARQGP